MTRFRDKIESRFGTSNVENGIFMTMKITGKIREKTRKAAGRDSNSDVRCRRNDRKSIDRIFVWCRVSRVEFGFIYSILFVTHEGIS